MTDPTLQPGQIVDRYVVESVLGEGGMAVVYKVRHCTLGSRHALKVLMVEGERERERLLAEGRAQGRLQHPNALTVTDVIDVQGAPGLVMEYVEGGTLEDWMQRERPDREDRIEAFKQICSAIAAAHEQGWIHRDLKPSNVLMDHVAGAWVPKVADFGLVKATATPLGKAKTKLGIAMGTPGFMSGEQFLDAANVKTTADVFSLGCILIWLLTERIPFEGDTPVEVYRNVKANRHVGLKPNDRYFDLSERCLDPDPTKRPVDAAALLQELGGVPTSGVDFGPMPTRTPAPARRHRSPTPANSVVPVRRGCMGLGCIGLAGAGLALVALLGISAALLYPRFRRASLINQDVCNLNGTGSMGFIRSNRAATAGQWLTLAQQQTVYARRNGTTFRRCHLPRGSRVRVEQQSGDTTNLAYDADATLPARAAGWRLLLGNPRN